MNLKGRPVKAIVAREVLVDLYIEKKMSAGEVAKELGVSAQTAINYLRKEGLKIRTPGGQLSLMLDLDEIGRLYCEEGWIIKDIAAKVGCSYQAVRTAMRQAGIKMGGKGVRRLYRVEQYKQFPGVTTDQGYAYTATPGHPSAKKRGHYLANHRLIVEKALGRHLTPDEHVHHVNVQKQDNWIPNLAVLNSSEHATVHRYMSHVAAWFLKLTAVRPGPVVFKKPVFWGGEWIQELDLIRNWESFEAARAFPSDMGAAVN